MITAPNPATQQHHTAILVSLVDHLRRLRETFGCQSFDEAAACVNDAEGYGVLAEIAADLDNSTAEEVDEELRKLWADALAAAAGSAAASPAA